MSIVDAFKEINGIFNNAIDRAKFNTQPIANLMDENIKKLEALKTDPCDGCEQKSTSSCCGADIIMGDICSNCKEHCDDSCDDCEFKWNDKPDESDKPDLQKEDEHNYRLYPDRI